MIQPIELISNLCQEAEKNNKKISAHDFKGMMAVVDARRGKSVISENLEYDSSKSYADNIDAVMDELGLEPSTLF